MAYTFRGDAVSTNNKLRLLSTRTNFELNGITAQENRLITKEKIADRKEIW